MEPILDQLDAPALGIQAPGGTSSGREGTFGRRCSRSGSNAINRRRKCLSGSRILMEFDSAKQPLRDVGGLKRRALGGRMGCKVARNSDENVPTLIGVAPLAELPHAGFQHLIGMEARVLPEQRVCKRCDE